jgi:2-octaprenyl-6-methoxyphenol hydroxylase
MTDTRVDVAIIGGGMVGASLAVALAGTGISTMLVEGTAAGSKTQPSFDDRTTALGNASRRIFDGLGIWKRLAPEAAAIRTIHVSDAGRFGFARLTAAEQGIDAFGYVISNRAIGAALWDRLQGAQDVLLRVPARPERVEISDQRVTFTLAGNKSASTIPSGNTLADNTPADNTPPGNSPPGDNSASETVSARLVVAADGAHSLVRAAAGIEADVEDYEQIAIVANVTADRPHDGTAYERFTQSGPLAVLPLHDGSYGVIWTCTPTRAAEVLSLDNNSYLRELQDRFGWRAGRFVRAGVRASYPLKLTRATTTVATRTVLIGNAAQALHPVAGQGFNLGLRDAAMLAEVIVGARVGASWAATTGAASAGATRAAPGADVGSPDLLRQFAAWREGDRNGVVRFTDGLVKMFASTRPGAGVLRNLGLLLFDLSPPAKSALARVSAGFAGPTPRLARGLELR